MAGLRPERALRWLDSLDGLAYAARLVWAGHWGRRTSWLLVLLASLGLLVAQL